VVTEGNDKLREGSKVAPQAASAQLRWDIHARGQIAMSKFFIRRPIVAMVIAILMVIAGVVSLLNLPTAQFPNIVPPEILVQATYPGADARTLEQAVATPHRAADERRRQHELHGVHQRQQRNHAADGGLRRRFQCRYRPDSFAAARLPGAEPASGSGDHRGPHGAEIAEFAADAPCHLVAHSTYDGVFLANYAYINLVDEVTRVAGVSRVQVFGAGQYALRVWVKPDQLAKLGVTVTEIVTALQVQNNVNPAGQIGGEPVPAGQQFTFTVRTQGRLVTAEDFGNIILRAGSDGSVLHLKDVARIELGAQTYNLAGRFNGKPAAIMAVYQLPGTNAVQCAKDVRARMNQLTARFPSDMKYQVALDTTAAVNAGIHEILITLGIALALVVLVVYIFLQGWRPTLIPLLAVPVSLVGTFMVFPALGFSINTLSLFGLVLAIGLVVDDAIVVVEAVEKHIEEGMSAVDATYAAMEQVSSVVVATALILSAVFIPTAFIPGITGRLYQQFAITIAISVIFSAFNALTLSPASVRHAAAAEERVEGSARPLLSIGSTGSSAVPRTNM
jgi:HAE1 family hydrophobic/amphiphilic exporter-1